MKDKHVCANYERREKDRYREEKKWREGERERNRLGEGVREIRIDKVRRRNGKRKRASENVRGSLNS